MTSLKDVIVSMLESVSSTDSGLYRSTVETALKEIGVKRPSFLISVLYEFLLNNQLPTGDRIFVLGIIHLVLNNAQVIDICDPDGTILLINLVTQEITLSKETDGDRANSASEILVALSRSQRFINAVMEQSLLPKFQPGVQTAPNRHIIMILAKIAEANPLGFLPFLCDILSRTNQIIPYLKGEPIRSAFCRALCSYCISITECNIGGELPMDIFKDHRDQFEPIYDYILQKWVIGQKDSKCRANGLECIGMLCMVISREKLIRDLKKLAETFINEYKKARSQEEQLAVSKGMVKFLEVCCSDESIQVEHYLIDMLDCLFTNVSSITDHCFSFNESDHASPTDIQMKLRSESLNVYCLAAMKFADKEVYYLLQKIQSQKEAVRLGAIELLRHLLNNAGKIIAGAQQILTMGLKEIFVCDQPIRIKMGLCQLCVSLADNNLIVNESEHHILHFLIKNLKADNSNSSKVSQHLQSQCAQALLIIAKTAYSEALLWPSLFEYFCLSEYNAVLNDLIRPLLIVCKNAHKSGRTLSFSEFDVNQKLAGPFAVMSRLFVQMYGVNTNSLARREAIELFHELSITGWFHSKLQPESPDTNSFIDERTSCLISYLKELESTQTENNEQHLNRNIPPTAICETGIMSSRIYLWYKKLTEFFSSLMDHLVDQEWIEKLTAVQAKQLPLYNDQHSEKAFLMCFCGLSLSRVVESSSQFIINHITLLKDCAVHSNYIERNGCAMAFGLIASTNHTDIVLRELENLTKESKRASAGVVSRIWSRSDDEKHYLKSMIILAFGYVVYYSSAEKFGILEKTALPFLRQYIENSKETAVREAHLEVINLLAIFVQHCSQKDYQFQARFESFSYIKQYVQSESSLETLNTMIRPFAIKAFTSLVGLKPPLSDNELKDLISLFSKYIFPICREQSNLKLESRGDVSASTVMEYTVKLFHDATKHVILHKPSVEPTLVILLKIFKEYYGCSRDHERYRAIELTVLALNVYLGSANDVILGHATDFKPLSSIIGRLSPRLCDSLYSIRILSLNAIWLALKLQLTYLGSEGKLDSNRCGIAMAAIAEIIEERLPRTLDQMQYYPSVLVTMLNDHQGSVASAAAQLISCFVRKRAELLPNKDIETFFTTIINALNDLLASNKDQTYKELLNAFALLSISQTRLSIKVLLKQQLPYNRVIIDLWSTLSGDRGHFPSLINYVLEYGSTRTPPVELDSSGDGNQSSSRSSTPSSSLKPIHYYDLITTDGGDKPSRIVSNEVCALLAALTELIKGGQPDDEVLSRVPELFALLLRILVAIVNTQFPKEIQPVNNITSPSKKGAKNSLSPHQTAVQPDTSISITTQELFKQFDKPAKLVVPPLQELLRRMSADAVIEKMNSERAWTSGLVSPDLYMENIASFCRYLCEYQPRFLGDLLRTMAGWLGSDDKGCNEFERIASICVIESLITKCPNENGRFNFDLFSEIFDSLVNAAIEDPNIVIRKLAIRGLGRMGSINWSNSPALIDEYGPRAVHAMMTVFNSDDCDWALSTEAFLALNSIIPLIDAELIKQYFTILTRIEPFLESEHVSLRSACFAFLEAIGKKVSEWDEYRQFIENNIITNLLHLNDEEPLVAASCIFLLERTLQVMKIESERILVEFARSEADALKYADFLRSFSVTLIKMLPENINEYVLKCVPHLKSPLARIRQNSALFIGFFLSQLPPEFRNNVPKEMIFPELVKMVRDSNGNIRISCIDSIKLLYMY